MSEFFKIVVSLVPVFVFLLALVFLDSFKLVRASAVVRAIVVGILVAIVSMYLNRWLVETMSLSQSVFGRYVAPTVEELLKAVYVVYLIKSQRVGFMVDAAVCGFAVGAGFALFENGYYLWALDSTNILLWVVRGFGTAVMHGGTMTIFGLLSMNFAERKSTRHLWVFLPGLLMALVIHSTFNHFLLPPQISALVVVVTLPSLIILVFDRSEHATREWLGVGLDTDVELLEMISSGQFSDSKVGKYLESLRTRFPGEIVADMLCLLRLHMELAVQAKGVMLMREGGIKVPVDESLKAKFAELKFLEKSIGRTGKLAIHPFLHTSSRSLWQLHMLGK